MARKIGVAVVSLGQYLGKDGRRRANNREVGIVMQHSDGRTSTSGASPSRPEDNYQIGRASCRERV